MNSVSHSFGCYHFILNTQTFFKKNYSVHIVTDEVGDTTYSTTILTFTPSSSFHVPMHRCTVWVDFNLWGIVHTVR